MPVSFPREAAFEADWAEGEGVEEGCHPDEAAHAKPDAAAGDFVVEWQLVPACSGDTGRVSVTYVEIDLLVSTS